MNFYTIFVGILYVLKNASAKIDDPDFVVYGQTPQTTTNPSDEVLYAVIGYCPTPFTSEGAVITISTTNTSDSDGYKILGKFDWPEEIFGCLYLYDPTVTFYEHKALLDFTSDFGFMIILDLETQTITDKITPKDPFFVGFVKLCFVFDYLLHFNYCN